MIVVRVALYAIAAAACLLGLWGILANLAIPLMPDYGNTQWNFFGAFEEWNDTGAPSGHRDELRIPWWALSFQSGCPYLDPVLAGPIGYGFYSLCCIWGLGTILLVRSYERLPAGPGGWTLFLVGALWFIGLGGILVHLLFFAAIAIEARNAGLTP